ncbi:Glucosidase 2 subunit beta [Pleurotus pulmonarius]
MIPLLLLLPLTVPALASRDKTIGVAPGLLSKYAPSSGDKWTCLDGSKQISWKAVNDDYCDCKDGSDEPGTSACANSTFYCRNDGHIGSTIPAWQVNDGLCEAACCDGSDELPGVCPNRCKEIGEAYRTKRDAERKLRKTGAKIRSTYIAYAHKEKKRLELVLQSNVQEIALQEKEVERLKDIAERTESISAAALEHKKESPLYQSIIKHSNALKSLQREHKKHLEREKALGDILDALRKGYNPNYQDMAVLEAVRGWEYLAGLPHINDVGKEDSEAEGDGEVKEVTEEPVAEVLEDGMWSEEDLEKNLDPLLNTDYVSLLLEHDEHVQTPASESVLFDLASYIPDSIYPQYEELKDAVISWLEKLGIVKPSPDAAADSSKARQVLTDAENKLNDLKRDQERAKEDMEDIFNPEGFGSEGEWKKLDGMCLEKDTGEYTYEVCLFGEAKQKPNHGGSTFSLGKFKSWNPDQDVPVGSPEFYTKQTYKHGTRCWNGPERNVILELSCGLENAIQSIIELEKCEYQFTVTTPALCLPLDPENGKDAGREEL